MDETGQIKTLLYSHTNQHYTLYTMAKLKTSLKIDIFCKIKMFKWFTNLKVLNVEKHNILWSRKEVGNIYGMHEIFAEHLVFIQVTV